jgi:hypothetical protein
VEFEIRTPTTPTISRVATIWVTLIELISNILTIEEVDKNNVWGNKQVYCNYGWQLILFYKFTVQKEN